MRLLRLLRSCRLAFASLGFCPARLSCSRFCLWLSKLPTAEKGWHGPCQWTHRMGFQGARCLPCMPSSFHRWTVSLSLVSAPNRLGPLVVCIVDRSFVWISDGRHCSCPKAARTFAESGKSISRKRQGICNWGRRPRVSRSYTFAGADVLVPSTSGVSVLAINDDPDAVGRSRRWKPRGLHRLLDALVRPSGLSPSRWDDTLDQIGPLSRPSEKNTDRTTLSIGSLLCPSRAKNMPQISFTAPKAHGALAGAGRVLETPSTARGRTSPPGPTTWYDWRIPMSHYVDMIQ